MAEYVVEFGKDGGRSAADGRLDAPAFHRNHQAIGGVLARFLAGKSGDAVEAGSGTGQHTVEFARQFPDITWWPSDLNENHLKSIEAWRLHSESSQYPSAAADRSVRSGLGRFDESGTVGPANCWLVFCANVIHIAPWRVAEGLVAGTGRYLQSGGLLFLYGPFRRDGRHTADSNAAFDQSLRERDPAWGVRDVEAVTKLADSAGLSRVEITEMPANNLTLVFSRR